MRCLVIDDNAEARFLSERILRRNGYRAVCVSGGTAALKAATSERFDVALVDLGMPDMSGTDTIRELRKLDGRIRILVVSGFGDRSHILAAIEAGADGYLLKDELGDQLGRALQEVFAGNSPLSPRVGSVLVKAVAAAAQQRIKTGPLQIKVGRAVDPAARPPADTSKDPRS